MSLQFYQIARIVELAWIQDPPQTLSLLLQLEAEVLKLGGPVEASVIRHAAAQLARGQSIQVIQVDGSATALDLAALIPEPAPEPAQPPAPHVQSRRKRRV